MTDLSVIIVNWNTCAYLRDCLASVLSQSEGLSLQIVVVDNASTDGSLEMLADEFPRVQVVANQENVGFAAANNQGIDQATGRHLLLLNPDTRIVDRALVEMVRYLDDHPKVAVVGPRLVLPDGTIQGGAAGYDPSPGTVLNHVFMIQRLAPNRIRGLWLAKQSYDATEIDVDWVAGACMMVRSDAVQQVGPMDTSYFMYAEDIEWCHRMRKAGWKVVCLGEVCVIHYIGGSVRQGGDELLALNVEGLDIYYRSRYSRPIRSLLHGAAAAGFAGRAVAYWLLANSRDGAAYRDTAKTMGACARASLTHMTRAWISNSDVRP